MLYLFAWQYDLQSEDLFTNLFSVAGLLRTASAGSVSCSIDCVAHGYVIDAEGGTPEHGDWLDDFFVP